MAAVDKKPRILLDFGECVRRCRTAQGLSQEAFGDACELDRSYIGGVERGERNPSLVTIVRMIQALEMEPSAFFRGLDSASRKAMHKARSAGHAEPSRAKRTARVKRKAVGDL